MSDKFEWPCDRRDAHHEHGDCPGVKAHPLTQIGGAYSEEQLIEPPTAEELDAEIDYVHIRRPDGSCVISMNGQGHFPCNVHGVSREH